MRSVGRTSGWLLAGVIAVGAGLAWGRHASSAQPPSHHKTTVTAGAASTPLRVAFEAQTDTLLLAFDTLIMALPAQDVSRAQRAFRVARRRYKQAETLLEFYSPSTTALLNGPPMDDDGDAPPRPLGEPALFQRIGGALFAETVSQEATTATVADARMMRATLHDFRQQTKLLHIVDTDFLDAARLEIARVSTLGINGVDAYASGDAIREQADAIDGVRALASVAANDGSMLVPRNQWQSVEDILTRTSAYLHRELNFDTMNRLEFLTAYANPAAHAIASARSASGVALPSLRRAWRMNVASVFDERAFDAWAYAREFRPEYAADTAPSLSAARLELGKQLFSDARLSGPGTHSCATCHVPQLGFTDGRQRSVTLPNAGHAKTQPVVRNVPTLLNAALQPNQFADERAGSLEQQIGMVLSSPVEMQSSARLAAQRISADITYRNQFRAVWGESSVVRDSVSDNALLTAIAAYVRSLSTMNSRFDHAVRGDTAALSAQERLGFNLFSGKARCATCHFAPIFNGTAPPAFASSEPEIINVPDHSVTRHARVDSDAGRAYIDGLTQHQFAFKVPTVRNVALTAPYMHNGVFTTLEQVVDFYNRGGGIGIGISSTQQTLSSRPLKLTDAEQRAIVAFLKSLTDRSAAGFRDQPVTHSVRGSVTRSVTGTITSVTNR